MKVPANKIKVLHIDVDEAFLNYFSSLYLDDFNITSVKEPENIIPSITKNSFDVVVSANNLGTIGGLEVLESIRDLAPDMPVIFLTGFGDKDVERDLFVSGAFDYFEKTVDGSEIEKIEKLRHSINKAYEKRAADLKLKHFEAVLEARRVINSLIIHEKRKHLLLKKVCEALQSIRGYSKIWILLVDNQGKFLMASQAGLDDYFPLFIENLRNERYPNCIKKVRKENDSILLSDREDHVDCIFFEHFCSEKCMLTPLKYEEQTLGYLSILIPQNAATTELETSIIQEAARDIAFALHDIDAAQEYRKAMVKITYAEDRLRTLLNSTPDFVIFKDGYGHWIEANHRALELFGISEKEYRGKTNIELSKLSSVSVFAFEYCQKTDRLAWEKRSTIREDLTISLPGAGEKVFDVVKVPLFYEDGTRKGIVIVGRDITDRRSTERALKISEEGYRMLVETCPDPIFIHREGKIQFVNPAGLKALRAQPEEVIGQSFLKLVHPDSKEMVLKRARQMLIDKKPVPLAEEKFIALDGRIIDVEVVAIPSIFDGKPAVQGFVRDITDRKRAERKLLDKNRELADFAYGVSHDLKSPLHTIHGFLSIVQEDPELLDEVLDKMIAESERAISFIEKLLELATVGKVIDEAEEIDLESTIHVIFDRLKHKNPAAKIKVKEGLPQIKGDPLRIEQVFVNLICNSMLHASEKDDGLLIEVYGSCRKNVVDIYLKDNGKGIEPEHIEKIFKAGYTKEKKKGTGLGLTIARKIVEAHGGTIEAFSEGIGRGIEFRISFPQN